MNLPELILCDTIPITTWAFEREFAGRDRVTVRRGDLLEQNADAYVSPANSFGDMSGGIDRILRDRFPGIEERVQSAIRACGTMLPVGEALIVETNDADVLYLIVAPTMEVPSRVPYSRNAYLAMRALLRCWSEFDQREPGRIGSIGIPGLCTGIGDMAPKIAAEQMRTAYDEFLAETAAR